MSSGSQVIVRHRRRFAALILALFSVGALNACGSDSANAPAEAVEVQAITVRPKTVPLISDMVGQVESSHEVELRAKVGGILEKKLFEDGALVKKGAPLFVIDSRPYQAALADARGKLAQSEASLIKARQDVERYRVLVEADAVSKQTMDNAISAESQAAAGLESARAALVQAQLNLDDTTINAPITGTIGRAGLLVGGLVQSGQTVLATISVDDPVYFYCSLSERDYLNFMKRTLAGGGKRKNGVTPVTLILADDSAYPAKGRFDFIDRAVSAQTGSLTVRARFPNPDGILRPGLFGKIRVEYEALPNTIAVPQKAVQEVLGKYFVTVIDEQDRARSASVTVGPRVGSEWVIEQGLRVGQRVVVEGMQKAQPGTPVKVKMMDDQPAGPQAK